MDRRGADVRRSWGFGSPPERQQESETHAEDDHCDRAGIEVAPSSPTTGLLEERLGIVV
jgi:hypothetical protein